MRKKRSALEILPLQLMTNPLEYIHQHPHLAKQTIGLNLTQLSQLTFQAVSLCECGCTARDEERKKQDELKKIRVNKKGAGRTKNLSKSEEICLTLVYLRQMPIFLLLGIMFGVSRTSANDIFHYWLPILRDVLPSSLFEEWERQTEIDELMKELLAEKKLLVDSTEQPRERPSDYEEQEKYFSGKKKRHTFKNQVISLPDGKDIVDAIIGERGPAADINLLRKQQEGFSKNQTFEGDKAYIGAERTKTPHKKSPKKELTDTQKDENKKRSQERIYIEHLIRIIKIFRVASERFRLRPNSYQQVIRVILGLVRLRMGGFEFSCF